MNHMDSSICESQHLPSSSSQIGMLPPELFQDIAFLSCNPNLYLTSRSIRSKLCLPSEFLKDLSFMLLCDRHNRNSAWKASLIPWRSSQARWADVSLSADERDELQQQVFNLEYITAPRLTMMIRFLLKTWVRTNAPFVDGLYAEDIDQVRAYLTTASCCCSYQTTYAVSGECHRSHWYGDPSGNRVGFSGSRGMSVAPTGQQITPPKYVVHVLYIPTRLLKEDKGDEGKELGRTLLYRTYMDSLNHSIVKKYMATAKPQWMHA